MKYQELELKYYVVDLAKIEQQLKALGAVCIEPRVKEINLRFDTADYSLTRAGNALRLRFDTQARLTFKGPSEFQEGVRLRQEIEFVADNFQAARDFLIALGYQISVIYEKIRTVYAIGDVHVFLDELPYGDFVEIEGPDAAQIQEINDQLGLQWETKIAESYTVLFERLREKLNLTFRDLVFEEFRDLQLSAADLGVQPADL